MRTTTIALVASACALGCACGGSLASPSPAPITYALTGRVVGTSTGVPLAGAAVTVGAVSGNTDGAGSFRLTISTPGAEALTIQGGDILTRRTLLQAATRDVQLDAIQLAAPFDLDFYRQIVRDSFDSGGLKPLRRWTTAPNIYLRTVDEGGAPLDSTTLDTTESAIRDTYGSWAPSLSGASVSRGSDNHAGQAGWITVRWMTGLDAQNACGQSDVALSGGTMDLFYKDGACGCNGSRMRPRTVRHELGHAMGFWHSSNPDDLMFGQGTTCDQLPSARERFHAGIAYSRAPGNTDPDSDPSTVTPLSAGRAR